MFLASRRVILVHFAFAEHGAERLHVKVDSFEGQHGKKQISLSTGEPGANALALGRVFLLKRDKVLLDVRVVTNLVGLSVVATVLVHPPGITDANHGISQETTGAVVGLAGFENLPVGGLVGEEGELGKDDPERGSDQELVPGVLQEDETGPGSCHRENEGCEHHPVVAGSTSKQPTILDCVQKRRVCGCWVDVSATWTSPDDAN